ncbi:MAG: hypothetical protein ACREIV_07195 [Planctomycetaceae bacterium]
MRADLKDLDVEIEAALPRTQGITRAHLDDLLFRIDEALRSKPAAQPVTATTNQVAGRQ